LIEGSQGTVTGNHIRQTDAGSTEPSVKIHARVGDTASLNNVFSNSMNRPIVDDGVDTTMASNIIR
jgi:hypothetical protein